MVIPPEGAEAGGQPPSGAGGAGLGPAAGGGGVLPQLPNATQGGGAGAPGQQQNVSDTCAQ